jgi:lipoprotein-anchoring transpeptidase ErfK/SrfK
MEAWVKTDEFTWSSSDYYVQVDISTNTVKVWEGDEVIVDEVAVVTGDVGRETPVATTFIDEIMPGPSSAYGPWLLSLGVFSDAINTFGSAGGLPKVAIHGTNRPDLLGQYASNGCIRLPNDVISMLAEKVPVGTRVDLIRSA